MSPLNLNNSNFNKLVRISRSSGINTRLISNKSGTKVYASRSIAGTFLRAFGLSKPVSLEDYKEVFKSRFNFMPKRFQLARGEDGRSILSGVRSVDVHHFNERAYDAAHKNCGIKMNRYYRALSVVDHWSTEMESAQARGKTEMMGKSFNQKVVDNLNTSLQELKQARANCGVSIEFLKTFSKEIGSPDQFDLSDQLQQAFESSFMKDARAVSRLHILKRSYEVSLARSMGIAAPDQPPSKLPDPLPPSPRAQNLLRPYAPRHRQSLQTAPRPQFSASKRATKKQPAPDALDLNTVEGRKRALEETSEQITARYRASASRQAAEEGATATPLGAEGRLKRTPTLSGGERSSSVRLGKSLRPLSLYTPKGDSYEMESDAWEQSLSRPKKQVLRLKRRLSTIQEEKDTEF